MMSGEQRAVPGASRVLGVLAVQGAFARHAELLATLGHAVRLIRSAHDMDDLDGLVLPGGESTVQLDMIARLGLEPGLHELVRSGRPVLATCAGLILLARGVSRPTQRSLASLDVDVARNAYGRQLDSFEASADEPWPAETSAEEAVAAPTPLPLVFIRAPRIERLGAGVEVLARHRGEPVLVRQGNVTAATFHPELTADARVHAAVFGRVSPPSPALQR
jgi:5'-phosphate synthase pdxT subunit